MSDRESVYSSEGRKMKKQNVILIDDNEDGVKIDREYLEDRGFFVFYYENPLDAFRGFSGDPAIIFLRYVGNRINHVRRDSAICFVACSATQKVAIDSACYQKRDARTRNQGYCRRAKGRRFRLAARFLSERAFRYGDGDGSILSK